MKLYVELCKLFQIHPLQYYCLLKIQNHLYNTLFLNQKEQMDLEIEYDSLCC